LNTGIEKTLDHPERDEWWDRIWVSKKDYDTITVPILHVGGWYDTLIVGTVTDFDGMVNSNLPLSTKGEQRLIIGPWDHSFSGENTAKMEPYRVDADRLSEATDYLNT
jgi:predicted acyl esterase